MFLNSSTELIVRIFLLGIVDIHFCNCFIISSKCWAFFTCTGLLSVNGNHVHISVSDSTGRTIGGHLLDSNLVYTTLEVVIGEDPDHVYHRETDSTYGYKELMVKPVVK